MRSGEEALRNLDCAFNFVFFYVLFLYTGLQWRYVLYVFCCCLHHSHVVSRGGGGTTFLCRPNMTCDWGHGVMSADDYVRTHGYMNGLCETEDSFLFFSTYEEYSQVIQLVMEKRMLSFSDYISNVDVQIKLPSFCRFRATSSYTYDYI